jgi:hypothetical protein
MATRAILRRSPRVATSNKPTTLNFVNETAMAEVLTQLAYVIFAAVEGLLALRFILRLVGANPFDTTISWVYNTTSVLVLPFDSILPSTSVDGSVLEASTLVAMVTYLFIFYLAVALFRLFVPGEQIINPEGEY